MFVLQEKENFGNTINPQKSNALFCGSSSLNTNLERLKDKQSISNFFVTLWVICACNNCSLWIHKCQEYLKY